MVETRTISSEFIDKPRLVAMLNAINQGAEEPKVFRRCNSWVVHAQNFPSQVSMNTSSQIAPLTFSIGADSKSYEGKSRNLNVLSLALGTAV